MKYIHQISRKFPSGLAQFKGKNDSALSTALDESYLGNERIQNIKLTITSQTPSFSKAKAP